MLTARHRERERGSMILAMVALMLLTLLALAVLQRSATGIRTSGRLSAAAAAEAGAEQGIAEALATISAEGTLDVSGAGTLPGGTYSFEVVASSASSITIYAEAAVDGVERAVEVILRRTTAGTESLFVDENADFGSGAVSVAGSIGTNGLIESTSPAPGDTQGLYGPDASCPTCDDPVIFGDRRDLTLPEAIDDRSQICPADGVFAGMVSGRNGRPILCADLRNADTVTFIGQITVVAGPLVLYVDGLDVQFTDAQVNVDGATSDFQLILVGDPNDRDVDLSNSRIDGSIEAPGWHATIEDVELVGQATLESLEVVGDSYFTVSLPAGVDSAEPSQWAVSRWQEVSVR